MIKETALKKKYGLPMAIAMVVGIVIGSGIFFKAETILNATGGNMPLGILAWILGGFVMLFCACAFAVLASKYEHVNGLVDYADATVGETYGYYVGWFMATIYYPTLGSVLAWVSARYTCVLLGFDIYGPECMVISAFFLISAFCLNALAPRLAGKFQISTLVVKLIPILFMAIVGTFYGLKTGMTLQNFSAASTLPTGSGDLFKAVVATSFAYEGWIMATAINAELKDAKKNMPLALTFGALAVVLIYTLYYIGISGVIPNTLMMESGQSGAKLAYATISGNLAGGLLFIFVIVSCLGTLNGITLGGTRTFYALAARHRGPKPEVIGQIDKGTNVAQSSAILYLLISTLWFFYFYGAQIVQIGGLAPWFGPFDFDSSELPIITSYAIYIPIFITFMLKSKEETWLRRFVLPVLACCGCIFMVVAAVYAHGIDVFFFLIIFAIIMAIGSFFSKPKNILEEK